VQVTSLDWFRKLKLMKLVQTVEVAFNNAPAKKPAIQVDDR